MKITVRKVRRSKDEHEEKLAREALDDGEQEDWETGKLGRDIDHMVVSDVFLSGKPMSVRVPDELRDKLVKLARKKGLSTTSYVRMILMEYVENQDRAA